MKYRKKPVVIEAVQITDSTFDAPHPNPEHISGVVYDPVSKTARIKTLEGEMVGNVGDWIVRGIKGELYPCKPDIFEATYSVASPAVYDGGPAFPGGVNSQYTNIDDGCPTQAGMSLRDWFAGKAVPTAMARAILQDEKHGLNNRWAVAATLAYEMADAMLAAKGPQ